MHIKQVLKLLAMIVLFVALVMLVPMFIAVYKGETVQFWAFANTIVVMIILGAGVAAVLHKTHIDSFSKRDGYLFTVLTWLLVATFGAIPLVLSKEVSSYSDAFFEIMSGLTTTGATAIADVEALSCSTLFWRSLTNWLGGMGIVVLFVALLPALGSGGGSFNLVGAETVGPVKGKLTPKTKTSAIVLWLIYIVLTALHTVLLICVSHLSLYDSLTIAFSTLSTAGFTIKNASIGGFGSVSVEVITTIFMLLAAVNFSIYYKVLTGKFREAFRDSELRWFVSIFIVATFLGACVLTADSFYPFADSLRHMAFQVASIITTTGFSSVDYLVWPSFCIMLLVMMMFIGGCAGSTGGGVKVIRVSLLMKSSAISIKKKIHQSGVYIVNDSGKPVEQKLIVDVFSFCALYFVTWLLGALLVSLSGADPATCLSSSLQCLGNIGAGFGKYGYGCFAEYPLWTKWVFSFLMLAGRLELFTLYTLFSASFYRR